MATKEELEIAIKVAKDLEHTVYAEQLEKKLKEVITPEEEKAFLKMFAVWIGNNGLHMKDDGKMAEMIFDYLKKNWDFSVTQDATPPSDAEQVEGWTYFKWNTIPHESLVSVMNGSRYLYKGKDDGTTTYIKFKNSGGFWEKVNPEQDIDNYSPFLLVKKNISVDAVSPWWDKNIEGK